MKKLVFLLAAAATVCLSSCNQEQLAAQQNTIDSLKREASAKDSCMDLLAQTMSSVQRNLDYIKDKEGIISMTDATDESGKSKIQQDIDAIYSKMVENKRKVDELQKKLNAATGKNKEYQKIIAVLQEQIDAQNAEITKLQDMLSQKDVEIGFLNDAVIKLSTSVDSLATESAAQQSTIAQQTADLNRAFYIIADKKTLTEKGLIQGVFKKTATGNNDDNIFTEIDKTTTNEIPLTGRRFKVISTHPESSYKIDEERSVLVIKNKEAFWKASNYLIIRAKDVNEED